TGAIVSSTVITCVLVTALLQKSRPTHVRVMMRGQVPLVTAEKVTTGLGSQLSVAVTVMGAGTLARHWRLAAGGTPTRIGAMVSSTVITCELVTALLQKSRATHLRVMTAGQVPLVTAESVTTGFGSQLSVAVTL